MVLLSLSGRFYVPSNKKRSGYVILVGLRSSIIEYSKETLSWQLVEQTHNTTATAEAQSCQRHIAKFSQRPSWDPLLI